MNKLKNFIKYNKFLYEVYKFVGNFFINLIGCFFRINENKVLFVSFGGKKYDDSPKEIYEKMISMKEFKNFEFVWAFINPDIMNVKGNPKVVKIDSFRYFIEALTSKYWIVNVSAQRGLNFKRKRNICINTWHGTPLKKIYGEENHKNIKISNRKKERFDLICSQSQYDKEIFSRIFNVDSENIVVSDLPRNDILLKYQEKDKEKIKKELNIPLDKKVILYMPTYREFYRNSNNECVLNTPINLKLWQEQLENDYVILMRLHYLVSKELNIVNNSFIRDVSQYPTLSELYYISDALISDYSSAYFDYSILERPMFCFAYDIEKYKNERGFYLDIYEELPCKINTTEQDLLNSILNTDLSQKSSETIRFKNKYAPYAGDATNKIINEILTRYIINE